MVPPERQSGWSYLEMPSRSMTALCHFQVKPLRKTFLATHIIEIPSDGPSIPCTPQFLSHPPGSTRQRSWTMQSRSCPLPQVLCSHRIVPQECMRKEGVGISNISQTARGCKPMEKILGMTLKVHCQDARRHCQVCRIMPLLQAAGQQSL